MRNIYQIQKDIDRVANILNNLILEKKLTIRMMEGIEVSSQILTEKLMERLRHSEDCGK